ncbi:hypothetical protein [Actinoplanes sp. TFC3]|uniref:hypothetical protein n=1 Tax=Actinoplanes sp. TFC3 TaxID=1710355 RepID=UPI000AADE48C|nr:hypothetical protein [Actinoplanes sp. TFC3]
MNPDELAVFEGQLRALVADHGLGWVLASVDEAVADGILQERTLQKPRRARRTEAVFYETMGIIDVEEPIAAAASSTGERSHGQGAGGDVGVTVRAYTPQERIALIIESVQRVVVELPEAAAQTRVNLSEAAHEPTEDIVVKFVGDDDWEQQADATSPLGFGQRQIASDPQRRSSLNTALEALKRGVLG